MVCTDRSLHTVYMYKERAVVASRESELHTTHSRKQQGTTTDEWRKGQERQTSVAHSHFLHREGRRHPQHLCRRGECDQGTNHRHQKVDRFIAHHGERDLLLVLLVLLRLLLRLQLWLL